MIKSKSERWINALTPTIANADVCLLLSFALYALLRANHLGNAPA